MKANKWILIVDDEPEVRAAIRDCFESVSMPQLKIVEAGDGFEAMHKMGKQRFDVLIADAKMPKLGGIELVESIRLRRPEDQPRKIIVISGHVDSGDVPLKLGVTFLKKPFNAKTLVTEVTQSLLERVAPKVDVGFIEPFIGAALKVLDTTAGLKAEKESLFVRKDDQISGDISALVAMNSEGFLGSMAISFEKRCFLAAVGNMLGSTYSEIEPEIQDACAELCNQIFGLAKSVLNKQGHSIQPAIPSVITGPGHRIKHTAQGTCLAVRFKTPFGSFTVEAVIQEKRESENAAA